MHAHDSIYSEERGGGHIRRFFSLPSLITHDSITDFVSNHNHTAPLVLGASPLRSDAKFMELISPVDCDAAYRCRPLRLRRISLLDKLDEAGGEDAHL